MGVGHMVGHSTPQSLTLSNCLVRSSCPESSGGLIALTRKQSAGPGGSLSRAVAILSPDKTRRHTWPGSWAGC
jgi:hypothetical protein